MQKWLNMNGYATYTSRFYLPPLYPREAKRRWRRKFRLPIESGAWRRMNFRPIPHRFNYFIYNKSPNVLHPRR